MKIYQVYFDDKSRQSLDKTFTPYDNSNPIKEKEFEYGVMRDIYFNHDPFKNNKYFGVLSWKFKEKTGLRGSDFVSWINKNKGYDVYVINPYPEQSFINYNVWYQGEYWHPGLIELTEKLFKDAGIDIDIRSTRNSFDNCSFCNYWVANKKFWYKYMYYCEKLYKAIYEADDDDTKKLLFDISVYGGGGDVAFFPFIFERMISAILASTNNFKYLMYDNLYTRTKDTFNNSFISKASSFINSRKTFDEYDIKFLNSFGIMYNDMVMRKFKDYSNYECGIMFNG